MFLASANSDRRKVFVLCSPAVTFPKLVIPDAFVALMVSCQSAISDASSVFAVPLSFIPTIQASTEESIMALEEPEVVAGLLSMY